MGISAKIVVSSYNLPQVQGTITKIMTQSPKYHVKTVGKPFIQKMSVSSNQPKIWGCDGKDVKTRSIFLSGSSDDLKKLLKIPAPDGVLIQLLPQ